MKVNRFRSQRQPLLNVIVQRAQKRRGCLSGILGSRHSEMIRAVAYHDTQSIFNLTQMTVELTAQSGQMACIIRVEGEAELGCRLRFGVRCYRRVIDVQRLCGRSFYDWEREDTEV